MILLCTLENILNISSSSGICCRFIVCERIVTDIIYCNVGLVNFLTGSPFLLILFALLCIPLILVSYLFVNRYLKGKKLITDNELEKEYKSMRVTLSAIVDAVIAMDTEGTVIFMNHIARELTGFSERESIGKHIGEIAEIISEDTRKPAAIPVENVIKEDIVFGLGKNAVLVSKNGIEHSIASSVAPIHGRSGRVIGVVMVMRDITERKLAEKQLRQEKDFLNSIVNNAGIIIIVLKPDGTIVKFNKFAETITGYSENELIGKKYFDIVAKDMHQQMMDNLELMRKGKEPEYSESKILKKDGNAIFVLWNNSIIFDNGEPELFLSMGINITERRKAEKKLQESYKELEVIHNQLAATQAELKHQLNVLQKSREALRESEERYRLAMEGANDGLWDWDIKTGKIFFSSRWNEMLGYDESEIDNNFSSWLSLLHPEDVDKVKKGINDHLEGKTPYFQCECSFKTKSGDYKWVLSRGKAIWNKNGKPVRMAGSQTDITERKLSEERIKYLAYYDSLTGLPNRSLFMDRISQALAYARRNNKLIALLFLDLDNFKKINDTLGHSFGDALLVKIGDKLKNCIRESDTIARLGGDEFIILQTHISSVTDVTKCAQRIISIFQKPWKLAGQEFYITTSIGITVYPNDGDDEQTLLKNADTAMYKAKDMGKNTFELFTKTMNNRILEKLEIERSLRRAIEKNELHIYYQPQIEIGTGRIIGVEALVRWFHPEQGVISPLKFIPLAEETGLITPIGEWILKTACRQNKKWQDMGYTSLCVAVNISARQFQQRSIVNIISEVLKEIGLEPECLEIEITESVAMQDMDLTIEVLHELKKMGIKISLDDFGTGYSSLSYLKRLPINTLKIDKTFVHGLTGSKDEEAITKSLITLAHDMNLTVTAEGVETSIQLDYLHKYNCDNAQGYLFSRPLPSNEITDILTYGLTENSTKINDI